MCTAPSAPAVPTPLTNSLGLANQPAAAATCPVRRAVDQAWMTRTASASARRWVGAGVGTVRSPGPSRRRAVRLADASGPGPVGIEL